MSESSEVSDPVDPETKSLVDGMWKALKYSVDRQQVDYSRGIKQKHLLDSLPSGFAKDMEKTLLEAREDPETPPKQLLFGKIFETLVGVDRDICDKEYPEGQALRAIMHNPGKFNLAQWGIDSRIKNPDIAIINGKGEIVGAVEAKSGGFNYRASKQIEAFKENLTKIVKTIRYIDSKILIKNGLEVLEKCKNTLRISNNEFKIILAVPYGSFKNSKEELIVAEDFNSKEKQDQALKNLNKCQIAVSPFSRRELGTLTNYVFEQLNPSS